ncbi:hypothetical protein [Aggregatilinea lenta]|uniref:hypothetical protein n=1 Tax=Aggregatilinea lenta TaxID=913108 RepID=UPI0013C2B4CC|nr:hypothetical protein [Aggregatilinea lenta]
MNDPNSPMGWETWRRGGQLGLRLVAVLFGATLILWLAMGLVGWEAQARALAAMCIGPVLGLGVIAGWWLLRGKNALAGTDRHRSGDAE